MHYSKSRNLEIIDAVFRWLTNTAYFYVTETYVHFVALNIKKIQKNIHFLHFTWQLDHKSSRFKNIQACHYYKYGSLIIPIKIPLLHRWFRIFFVKKYWKINIFPENLLFWATKWAQLCLTQKWSYTRFCDLKDYVYAPLFTCISYTLIHLLIYAVHTLCYKL